MYGSGYKMGWWKFHVYTYLLFIFSGKQILHMSIHSYKILSPNLQHSFAQVQVTSTWTVTGLDDGFRQAMGSQVGTHKHLPGPSTCTKKHTKYLWVYNCKPSNYYIL